MGLREDEAPIKAWMKRCKTIRPERRGGKEAGDREIDGERDGTRGEEGTAGGGGGRGERLPDTNGPLLSCQRDPRRTLPYKSEKWAWGDGEAVLGEIQGQNTHGSSIYHLPPQAQHITSLLDIITPGEERGLAAPLARGHFNGIALPSASQTQAYNLSPINGLPPLHPGLTPCLSRALWRPALMTDNVCNYQPNSHKELMKNQAGTPLLISGPLFPLIHSEWRWALNEALLDAAAAAALAGLTVISAAI
ncbi:unnamed protein product [Pleuronectes platessa]|uniref:Uncharacterized protein n=1 Tax=Pleuronectes platessa TaxID=8262 RepID=A0A9N7YNY6_PLEPL|nr:unnamed protein product [Pleuronectes platessa]